MGRQVLRVPANWQHPKEKRTRYDFRAGRTVEEEGYKPLYMRCDGEEAWADWQKEFAAWQAGEHARVAAEYGEADYPLDRPYTAFCRWHGRPPSPNDYRPRWAEGSATWWQVYETVSEGTPVTPAFATAEELIDYLAANGDFWDQTRRAEGRTSMPCGPWGRAAAESFVRSGSAPSMVVTHTAAGVEIKTPGHRL